MHEPKIHHGVTLVEALTHICSTLRYININYGKMLQMQKVTNKFNLRNLKILKK